MSVDALTDLAGLLADRSRAVMCLALLDGRAWTATELGREAGIAPSTASEHLSALVAAGLLAEVRQGRHRYLRLAGPQVAALLEGLGSLAPPSPPSGLRQVRAAERLAAGRTCYDHLAGDLGVGLYEALQARGLLDPDGGLTEPGRVWFGRLLGPEALQRRGSRPLVRTCLDWTRRVPHLGGALGAALCAHALGQEWVVRSPPGRAVALTSAGERAFARILGVALRG